MSRNLWLLPGTARQRAPGTVLLRALPTASRFPWDPELRERDAAAGPRPPYRGGTKRAGLVWIAIAGQDRPRPAWHIWRGPGGRAAPPGAAYMVTGPGEQPLPGLG